jgi:hypothetical protein
LGFLFTKEKIKELFLRGYNVTSFFAMTDLNSFSLDGRRSG